MTEAQQYELGAYVNLMNSSTQLLVNPVNGLQPKYDIRDLKEYIDFRQIEIDDKQKILIVALTNLLYKINLDEKDKAQLWKSFKGNKNFLCSVGISKKDFALSIFETVDDALNYKYSNFGKAS